LQFLAGLRPNKSTISRRDTSSTAEASHEGSGSRIPCVKGAATKAAQPKFPGNSRNAKLFAAELVLGEPQNLSRSHWQHFRSRICLAGTTRSRTSLAAELVSELGSEPLVSEPLAAELVSEPLATEPLPRRQPQQNSLCQGCLIHSRSLLQRQTELVLGTTRSRTCLGATGSTVSQQNLSLVDECSQ
jgi:hypothetical protein